MILRSLYSIYSKYFKEDRFDIINEERRSITGMLSKINNTSINKQN